ncbi:phage holin family protein [Candidatus Fermentibacteria bacterium]|nr:MAG: phage holin family protein [Candidatus Fermentibacteria bacterium]
MKKLIGAWIVAGVALWLTSMILGARMEFTGFWSIVWTAGVIGLLNFVLAPILNIMTCPVYLLTLGLSRFLVSGLVLIVAREWVGGFYVASYWWAVLAAVIISLLTGVIDGMTGRKQ